ncbi:hypothetical protein BDZ91DRAFT_282412 [Kalaharituber pfeilii]|nr:hypothetical protein BDZ91DRAFT_282412 [Kalaharituber pfeilii]
MRDFIRRKCNLILAALSLALFASGRRRRWARAMARRGPGAAGKCGIARERVGRGVSDSGRRGHPSHPGPARRLTQRLPERARCVLPASCPQPPSAALLLKRARAPFSPSPWRRSLTSTSQGSFRPVPSPGPTSWPLSALALLLLLEPSPPTPHFPHAPSPSHPVRPSPPRPLLRQAALPSSKQSSHFLSALSLPL